MSKTYPPNNSDVCPRTCGALPHGVGVRTDGTVGLTKYRKSSRYAADGGWSVVCTRCGRVGERGSTQIDAKARWNAHRFRYDRCGISGCLRDGSFESTDHGQRHAFCVRHDAIESLHWRPV